MREGSCPESSEKRDGPQRGLEQYAEANVTPCDASLDITGVSAVAPP